MKKQKIEFEKYKDKYEIAQVRGKDDVTINVRTHIPYADKIQMAREIIEQCVMTHDDSICYEGFMTEAIQMLKILEYYTDVDTEGVEPEEAADFLINNELYGEISETIRNDWREFLSVFYRMLNSVMEGYKDDRGLTKAIRTSFGFLFNGEDITESLAKAEATKDTMYKALGALNEKELEEKEKLNNGKLMIGDNIINFAKKRE